LKENKKKTIDIKNSMHLKRKVIIYCRCTTLIYTRNGIINWFSLIC